MIDLPTAALDPYEAGGGNNSIATATYVDAGSLQQVPQTPYVTTGARISPRGGDIDWYCLTMRTGDRLIANAVGTLRLETGMTEESPWVDPLMSLWRPDGTGTYQKVLEDDDNGPLVLDALIDTGELAAGGPMCVAVTTYGDTAYTGANQLSAGDYRLTLKMGDRSPTLSVTSDGGTLPVSPAMVTINEGDTFSADLTYSDIDQDPLTATWDLVGASSTVATQGSFANTSTGMSTFTWTASQTAARDSPYVLTLAVSDGQLSKTVTVIIRVLEVNIQPTVPIQLSPVDGGHVMTLTPQLVCSESFDPDQETITYQYELYYGPDAGMPAQSASIVGIDGGWITGPPAPTVTMTATTIAENTRVQWRVRAYDGHPSNGYSPWSAYANFIVDLMNDPPLAPVITKPLDGAQVLLRTPTITVAPPVDPEDDPMQLFIEVSTSSTFTTVLVSSGALDAGATPTMWTVDGGLDYGGTYYVRAHADDNRGGVGPFSAVNMFSIEADQPPSVPPFTSPDATGNATWATSPRRPRRSWWESRSTPKAIRSACSCRSSWRLKTRPPRRRCSIRRGCRRGRPRARRMTSAPFRFP